MNFLIKIILSLFLFVQTAPTLICLIYNEKSISIEVSDEDESYNGEKEFKVEFIFDNKEYTYFSGNQISKNNSEGYLIKYYKVYTSAAIIPPKM